MKRFVRGLFVVCSAIALGTCGYSQDDVAGSSDYPGISRMPGYYIYEYQETQFASFTFHVKIGNSLNEQAVEGRRLDLRYNMKDGATMPSPLQIHRNYQNAAKAVGGQVLYSSEDETTIRFHRDGHEVWANIENCNAPSGMCILMKIVEQQAMKQDVEISADAMASSLTDSGSVAVYGIFFETAKSELKPDSDAELDEIAKLLKEKPGLKVFIVGHTDMVGDPTNNAKLSLLRAQAVVSALIERKGVAGTRLIPFGAGPYAPVASNKTSEGRAKNRRVELVEISTQ